MVTFRDWLGPLIEGLGPSDNTLVAVVHLVWEVVGTLTQDALLKRYHEDLCNGRCDLRAVDWKFRRHVLAALSHGICTTVLVPLTDSQAKTLLAEGRMFHSRKAHIVPHWRAHAVAAAAHMRPHHFNEALRRLQQDNHPMFGLAPIRSINQTAAATAAAVEARTKDGCFGSSAAGDASGPVAVAVAITTAT